MIRARCSPGAGTINLFSPVNIVRFFSPAYGKFLFRLPENAMLLDIGCGDCSSLAVMKRIRPDLKCFGVDLEEHGGCRDRLTEFRRADLNRERIAFDDSGFDAIRACHILEHLEKFDVLQAEIGRLLKPGGIVYVEAPNPNSLKVPSFSIFRRQGGAFNFHDDPSHVRPLTVEDLTGFLSGCGLEVLDARVVRNPLKILISPAILLVGMILRKRSWLIDVAWQISGWCSCAIGRKKDWPDHASGRTRRYRTYLSCVL